MTQLVQRLERQGLTTRVGDPDDGRAVLVSITDAGRALMEERRAIRDDRLRTLLSSLSAEDAQALAEAARLGLPALRHLMRSALVEGDARDDGGPAAVPPPG